MHRLNPRCNLNGRIYELRLNLASPPGLKCLPWIAIGNANHFNIVWNER